MRLVPWALISRYSVINMQLCLVAGALRQGLEAGSYYVIFEAPRSIVWPEDADARVLYRLVIPIVSSQCKREGQSFAVHVIRVKVGFSRANHYVRLVEVDELDRLHRRIEHDRNQQDHGQEATLARREALLGRRQSKLKRPRKSIILDDSLARQTSIAIACLPSGSPALRPHFLLNLNIINN